MNRYALVFKEDSCWGCKACEVACKQEHNTPDDVKFISVAEDGPKMVDGKLDFTYRVNLCKHCDEPPCRDACPVGAITKREDGIVILDEKECTGCRSCIEACPYQAISFDSGKETAQKCNLCYFRIDHGLIPACADNVCLAHCVYFGGARSIDRMIGERFWLKHRTEGKLGSLVIKVEE